jgi:hypothetical protein
MNDIALGDKYYKRVITGHEGTHLAESRRTSGAFVGGELDDETNQVSDQAEWIEVPPPDDEDNEDCEDDESDDALGKLGLAAIVLGTVLVTCVATQYVAPWWAKKGYPSLKRLWRKVRRKDELSSIEITQQESSLKPEQTAITAGAFSQEIDKVLEQNRESLSDAEAQQELLKIMYHAAAIAASIRRLSNSASTSNLSPEDTLEWRQSLEKLATDEVTLYINLVLKRAKEDDEAARLLANILDTDADSLLSAEAINRHDIAQIFCLTEDHQIPESSRP